MDVSGDSETASIDDDDVYLIEKLQHVGYKIYLLTDQPMRHKYKMNAKQQ
jgi:hypothetical protein